MSARTADVDYGVGSCSPGGSIFPLRRPYPLRTHYRANEHRKRTSCGKSVDKARWSDDPRKIDCVNCRREEMW